MNTPELNFTYNFDIKVNKNFDNANQAVSKINDSLNKLDKVIKDIKPGSINALKDGVKKLNDEINNSVVGSEEFLAAQKKLVIEQEKLNKALGKEQKLPKIKEEISDSTKALDSFTSKITEGVGQIPVFGNALSGMLTKLGPVGIAIGVAVTAFTALGVHVLEVTKEMRDINGQFEKFGNNGKDIDEVSGSVFALSKRFGKTPEEIKKATQALVTNFGIDGVEALKNVETALIATNGAADLNDFVEFAPALKAAGAEAKDLVNNLSISKQEGLLTNKSADAVKSFVEQINKADDSTGQLLKTIGLDPKKVFSDLKNGVMTQKQLFDKIYSNIDKYDLKTQQALKDMLGGGKDIGNEGLKAITQQIDSADELIKKGGAQAEQTKLMVEQETKLGAQKSKNVKNLIPLLNKWDLFVVKIQLTFEEILEPIIGIYVKIGSILSKLLIVKIAVGAVVLAFKIVVGYVKTFYTGIEKVLTLIESLLIGLEKIGDYLGEKFTQIFDKVFGEGAMKTVKKFFTDIFDWIGKKFLQLGDFFNNIFESINEGLKGNIDKSKAYLKAAGNSFQDKQFKRQGSEWSKEELDQLKKDQAAGKPNPDLKDIVKNDVSGVKSETKNIYLNLRSLQEVHQQIINNGGDANNVMLELIKAMSIAANSVNQTASK